MSLYNSIRLIVNAFLVLLIVLTIIWFLIERRKDKLDKRLKKYTINQEENSHSLFDVITNTFYSWRSAFGHLLKKSSSLKKYALKYEKFIDKRKSKMEAMDYVSTKFILAFLLIFVLIVSNVLQNSQAELYQIAIAFLLGFYSLDVILIGKKKYVLHEMENDLLKAITIMNNAFKSGRSIVQTIDIVGHELDGPLKDEFIMMHHDLEYGLDIQTVFERMEKRVDLKEIGYIKTSLTILNQTGGNIVSVFSSIEKTVFNNKKLKDELKNLSAASKALYRLLSFIPLIFVLLIYVLDPTYFIPLFNTTLGIIILILLIALYISYILVVRKIIRLKEY